MTDRKLNPDRSAPPATDNEEPEEALKEQQSK